MFSMEYVPYSFHFLYINLLFISCSCAINLLLFRHLKNVGSLSIPYIPMIIFLHHFLRENKIIWRRTSRFAYYIKYLLRIRIVNIIREDKNQKKKKKKLSYTFKFYKNLKYCIHSQKCSTPSDG